MTDGGDNVVSFRKLVRPPAARQEAGHFKLTAVEVVTAFRDEFLDSHALNGRSGELLARGQHNARPSGDAVRHVDRLLDNMEDELSIVAGEKLFGRIDGFESDRDRIAASVEAIRECFVQLADAGAIVVVPGTQAIESRIDTIWSNLIRSFGLSAKRPSGRE